MSDDGKIEKIRKHISEVLADNDYNPEVELEREFETGHHKFRFEAPNGDNKIIKITFD